MLPLQNLLIGFFRASLPGARLLLPHACACPTAAASHSQHPDADAPPVLLLLPQCLLCAVNTNFTRVDGPLAPAPLYDVLVINHYILRSAEEFQRKLSKSSDVAFPGYT